MCGCLLVSEMLRLLRVQAVMWPCLLLKYCAWDIAAGGCGGSALPAQKLSGKNAGSHAMATWFALCFIRETEHIEERKSACALNFWTWFLKTKTPQAAVDVGAPLSRV